MARRTKREMEYMNSFVRLYLLSTNNNPHKAHEAMIKEHLETAQMIPYYITGVKDFIKVSQELAVELNRKDQMAKKDRERHQEKESVKNYIMSLGKEEIKTIYKQYKNEVTQSEKLILHDLYMMIFSDDLQEKYIDQAAINLFSKIYLEVKKVS